MNFATWEKAGIFILAFLFIFMMNVEAQTGDPNPWHHRGNNAWPDSLELVTFEGVVMMDTTVQNPYLLDVDFDGVADYRLAFGPDWYQPESGAERPVEGDTVTIVGAVHLSPTLPIIVVFEINGLTWREPVENWWHHRDWPDTLEVVTITGTVLVDTTYFYVHYYLDENNDEIPDYFLDFGPPWYEPEGVSRPEVGSTVTIEGGLKLGEELPVIVVFIIDGETWREPIGPPPWAGKWIHQNCGDTIRVHCPTDSLSWVDIPPGAMSHGGHHGGPQFPDSVFCEFMQIYGDSLPGRPDSAMFGFHFYFANPSGHHVAGNKMNVHFMKKLHIAFHYGNCDTTVTPLAKALNKNDVVLKYWDSTSNIWIEVEDLEIDDNKGIIYLNNTDVQTYYAIFKTGGTTDIEQRIIEQPGSFSLGQNYPNPFNPITEIVYQVHESNISVNLSIYNLQGQVIRTLVNKTQPSGSYRVVWDGRDENGRLVSSGIYLYRLTAGEMTQTRRMIFLK